MIPTHPTFNSHSQTSISATTTKTTMVEIVSNDSTNQTILSAINLVIFSSDTPSKLHHFHHLHQLLSPLHDPLSLAELFPRLSKLITDRVAVIRKSSIQIIGEIGLKHLEFLPQILPSLLAAVDDDTPAVARQAITSGTNIFGCTLEKIAIQGLHTSELDDSFKSAWAWMLKLKEKIYSVAFQAESDGRRLLAMKFIATIILIYTPDPNGSPEPPPHQVGDGKEVAFNISWLRRGHPVLKVGDLSIEASRSLGLLLDQLRMPIVKSLSSSMVVVLINCLSSIATKRPSFYGRILSVILSLDPSHLVVKGLLAYGVQHALKKAFLSCLKCTHPSAIPWRDRLVGALREMKAGALAEQVLEGVLNINGNIKQEKVECVVKKEEQSAEVQDTVNNKVGRKRSSDQEFVERSEDDDTPGKRARSIHTSSEGTSNRSSSDHTVLEVKTDATTQATKSEEDDMGPVQQLVAVFGAFIAQGEKGAASLELLISSINADLLAQVVISNLRNLPPTRPTSEADGEILGDVASPDNRITSDTPFRELSSFLTDAFTPRVSHPTSSAAEVHPPTSDDLESTHAEESSTTDVAHNEVCTTSMEVSEIVHSDQCAPAAIRCSEVAKGCASAAVHELQDMETVDAVIPGLSNIPDDELPDTVTSSLLVSIEQDGASQDQATSGKFSIPESVPSLSTEKSEELSAKTVAMDTNTGTISTATSLGQVQHFVLPKISAPVIDLSDQEKDKLQKFHFTRILEAYKQVAVAGGSQLRFSLLAYLGVEFPLELDPWELLQTHILSDYINHEGHELTLRVLYRLYGEVEERDFLSSSAATSAYETFLLKVAETLRDSFPASDKSLSRLLGEVPYLPNSVLKVLERLCCPESGDKDEKEVHSGDRVMQGLSAVWSLIMLRPSLRNVLLRIALQSAVHHLEEVRMKAIRLVANKLYPLPTLALQIEEFAKERLLFVVDGRISDPMDTEKSGTQSHKNPEILASNDQGTADTMPKETSTHDAESCTTESTSTSSISEAQRCMSLYFALCTKKHVLLRQIFVCYNASPESVKQAVHRHMPILIRTMGASPALLGIISDPPDGSEDLLMQILHTLTDGIIPSTELISTIKNLYESKMKNIEILLPILSFLPKEEVLRLFPRFFTLPQDKFQAALTHLLQGSAPSDSMLSPPEVLIAIHVIDPDKDGIPLKKVTDACNACFAQKEVFTQQVIAKVLNQLVEQIPLPLLFMRTVLQAIGAFPALVDFIMDILSRLVNKQIWKYPKLWVGFLKCVQLTQPHSFNVLLQLPPTQLESALNKIPALKAPLSAHANQSNMKSTLPRSVLSVLGIASETQTTSQAGSQSQSAQPEVADASSLDKAEATEKSKESEGS